MTAAAEDALRFCGRTIPSATAATPNRRLITTHQPIGTGGFISPWNFPVEMILNVATAMVVGNTTVWKPSEFAPYAPQLVAETFSSVGFPAGAVNLVYGGADVGERIVGHPDVGFISFIGSTAVGEQIARVAGVKRLQLELGGNGPLVVLDDADLEQAVEAAMVGCFFQAGQVCTASERVLVQAGIHDRFVARLKERVGELKVGDPLDETTEMGPLINSRILEKTTRHVAGAVADGARVVAGGESDALFFEPTVLVDVQPEMEIAREETFGPVAPVIRFETLDEAVEIANDSPYGLQVAVISQSLTDAWTMAERLEAGVVVVNASNNEWDINAPFGGVKKSGYGRELGEEGLRCYTNVKQISFHLV
jgi:acyl-CoA reductase-like NAD-dependent aldehyde dehydrogenase